MSPSESSPPSRRSSGPRKLGDVLPQLMARRGYSQLLSSDELAEAWQRASGSLSGQTRVGRLSRGVLEIYVSSSVVVQELTFQKRELINRLRRDLPQHKLHDLRFTVGTID